MFKFNVNEYRQYCSTDLCINNAMWYSHAIRVHVMACDHKTSQKKFCDHIHNNAGFLSSICVNVAWAEYCLNCFKMQQMLWILMSNCQGSGGLP